jgi:hypothetical protein
MDPEMDQRVDDFIKLMRDSFAERPVAVFIDPTLGDPIEFSDALRAEYLAAEKRNCVQRIKLPHIHNNFDPQRHPYLLHVENEEAAERLITATVKIALQESLALLEERQVARTVCGWMPNRHPDAATLAAHLSCAAKVTKPDGMPWYLRYWDPRVIWQLPRVLPEPHWIQMQKVLEGWHYIAPNLLLSVVDSPDQLQTSHQAIVHKNGPVVMSSEAWEGLQRIGTINSALAIAGAWGVQPDDVAARQIESLLIACERNGFVSERDGLVFVACGLSSHLRFYEHPLMMRALEQARHTGSTLNNMLQQFDEEFWEQLRTWQPSRPDATLRRE